MKRGLLIALVVALGWSGSARAEGDYPRCNVNHDGRVLVVGDSLTVFGGECDQYPRFDVNGWAGRTTEEGVDELERLRPRHEAVIYDLGSNDVLHPGITRPALRKARRAIGDRTMFIPTIARNDSWPYEQVNEVIRDFGSRHSNVRILPWAAEVAPEDFLPDGVHYTPEGYVKRTAFLEERVGPVLQRAKKKRRR